MLVSDLPFVMIWCLTLTAAVEYAVALGLGVSDVRDGAVVLLVNVMTNPLLVSASYLVMLTAGKGAYYPVLAVSEIAVVLAEGLVYKFTLRTKRNPFLLALILNAASFAAGEFISAVVI